MSSDSRQNQPSGAAGNSALDADGDNEIICDECRLRCTVGPDGTEYGHSREYDDHELCPRGTRCPNRPPPEAVDPIKQGGRYR